MAKQGLSLPVRANPKGGVELARGTPYLEQSIAAAFCPNLSNNPFQLGGGEDIGLSEDIIFSQMSHYATGLARRDITRVMTRFRDAGLARLVNGSEGMTFLRDVPGQMEVIVKYVDIEADKESEFRTNLKGNRVNPAK